MTFPLRSGLSIAVASFIGEFKTEERARVSVSVSMPVSVSVSVSVNPPFQLPNNASKPHQLLAWTLGTQRCSDLALKNVMVQKKGPHGRPVFKLIDFGLARRFITPDCELSTISGTVQYQAPENQIHQDGLYSCCGCWGRNQHTCERACA